MSLKMCLLKLSRLLVKLVAIKFEPSQEFWWNIIREQESNSYKNIHVHMCLIHTCVWLHFSLHFVWYHMKFQFSTKKPIQSPYFYISLSHSIAHSLSFICLFLFETLVRFIDPHLEFDSIKWCLFQT